nr:MAG TPA: hypothetical protein [Microviridae sp.]
MSEKNTLLRGFAKYSLNRELCDHSQTCFCNIDERVVLAGNLMEANPVQDFLFDVHADGSVTFCSDYSILSGQKAIDQMNPMQLRSYINSLHATSSPYSNHYSDDMLLEYCKDRNIQSSTELNAWLGYLISEGQSLEADVHAFQAARLAAEQKSAQSDGSISQSAAQSSSE